VKFAFIHVEKAFFPVAALCRVLEVTRQGYYAYAKRSPSQRQRDDEALQERVRTVHEESDERYGSPRMHEQLQRDGLRVGKRRIERAMRGLGLVGRKRRRFRVTTVSDPSHAKAENLLDRDFTATRPNERWVTDITYVWTDSGWCYLAIVLDLYSRAVVGWSVDATMATTPPLRALENALQTRRPSAGLLHHSDQGCQYTSAEYRRVLAEHGITASMSRRGNCWDNAVAESFFATLKTELIHDRRWRGLNELRAALFDYIAVFYNRKRLHSSLGYQTPAEIERAYALASAA